MNDNRGGAAREKRSDINTMKTKELVSDAGRLGLPTQTNSKLASIIAAHPFLKDLDPHQQRLLTDCAMEKSFEAGELIFREGDPANRFYLIQEGKVALESEKAGQKPVLIQTLGVGEVLGWSWLFPPYYWHFNARALEPTKAIFFYGTRLREQSEEDPVLGYELL